MKISVVIPTYCRPALLSRCLEALYHQKFDKNSYEIVVVSDGPDPKTKEVIQSFRGAALPHLIYCVLPERKGPASARNIGWRHAASRLIAFTDDDCIPDIYWLQNFYNAYLRINKSEVAFTGHTVVPISQNPTDYERNIANLEKAEFITANCACTRKALLKVGGFDEQFSMAWREDSDLQFKFIKKNIPIIPVESKVIHPVRNVPWGVSIREEKKGMFDALLYKKYPVLYRKKIQASPPWRYYAIAFFFLIFLVGAVTGAGWIALTGLAGWMALLVNFIHKRLVSTRHTVNHIFEMIVTSLVIPFLSLFWRWYGIVKYKTSLF